MAKDRASARIPFFITCLLMKSFRASARSPDRNYMNHLLRFGGSRRGWSGIESCGPAAKSRDTRKRTGLLKQPRFLAEENQLLREHEMPAAIQMPALLVGVGAERLLLANAVGSDPPIANSLFHQG